MVRKMMFLKTKKNALKLATELKFIKQELQNIRNWQCNFYKDIPEKFPLRLSEKEQEALINYLKNSNNYLEFGSGGSSFLALLNSNAKVYSVESDETWIDYLRTWKFIRKNEENKRILFNVVNIGSTKEWGYPVDDRNREKFPDYSMNIFKNLNKINIDTVFIDGRFRIACALAALINYPNAIILIHDYTFRSNYHVLEQYLDKIETIDTLSIFKIKKDIDKQVLYKAYNQYKYDID